MKIILHYLLPFQVQRLEFEVARKQSKIPICECDQSDAQFDFLIWASACAITHAK